MVMNLSEKLTIVIPCKNEGFTIKKSLDLLNEFTFEIQPSRSIPIQFKNNEISLNENIGFNFSDNKTVEALSIESLGIPFTLIINCILLCCFNPNF